MIIVYILSLLWNIHSFHLSIFIFRHSTIRTCSDYKNLSFVKIVNPPNSLVDERETTMNNEYHKNAVPRLTCLVKTEVEYY